MGSFRQTSASKSIATDSSILRAEIDPNTTTPWTRVWEENDDATTLQPPQPRGLERPREESNDGDTQDAQSQLRKALYLTIFPPF